jgi:type VI secretion system protein ImpK
MEREELPQGALSELCTDFFLFGMQIRSGNVELPACQTLKRRVLLLFETLKNQADRAHVSPTDVEDVRYALAAYIDEMVQYADWEGKHEWAAHPLQAQLFGESRAGVGFFDRLQEVRRRSPAALEVYYLCLTLGFQGEYGISGSHELDDLIEDLQRELTRGTPKKLSPHGSRPETAGLAGKGFPLLPVAGALVLLAIIIVSVLYILLGSEVGEAADLLEQMGRI